MGTTTVVRVLFGKFVSCRFQTGTNFTILYDAFAGVYGALALFGKCSK